jgi:hypothetical protein
MYWWRSHLGSTWRSLLAIVVVGGLLGAVALGALAGARRTASAYSRYLASTNASDALVNIPGLVPGMPVTRPMTLISHLPGVSQSAVYIGMDAYPVVDGKVVDAFQTNDVTGTLSSSSFGADGFSQDKMTVLAGRLPSTGSTSQVVLTPGIAARRHPPPDRLLPVRLRRGAAGIPLGIVAGRLAWRAFAGSLGVAPITVFPALLAVAGAAALLIAGNVLTSVPGAIAARTSPSVALRAE